MKRLRAWWRARRYRRPCDVCDTTTDVETFIARFEEDEGGSALVAYLCPDHAPQEAHP